MSPHLFTSLLLRVVLDANVLAYVTLGRLLIGLAREGRLFSPYWSEEILAEVLRTCTRLNKRGAQGAHEHLAHIQEGFPDALQTDLEPLIAQCTNDAKDRHILASAIKSTSRVIVTFNQKHFLPQHLEKWGITTVNPNDFLLELHAQNPQAMWRQISVGAEQKGMELDEFVRGYSEQLARFKNALLADFR